MSFAFFKKGKGQHGANNQTTKDDIFLVKVENRLSQYINDPEFISRGDIVQTVSEATLVSAEHVSGLTFNCTAENFPILADGKYYRAVPNPTLTLDPEDATNDRIDLIIAVKPSVEGGLGYITKITGEPSATPSPPDYDYSRHFPIKFVYVKNAVESTGEPLGFANETIFNENLGEPTEWTFSTNSPATIAVSTDDSSDGTNSIEFTTLSSFNTARFTNDVLVNSSTINLFTFKIKLKAPYKTNKTVNLFFRFNTGGVYYIFVKDGEYGFNANNLDWQKITVPMYSITPSFSFNTVWLGFNDTNHLGCYVDEIKLQAESEVVTPPVADVIPNLQEVTDKGNITNRTIVSNYTADDSNQGAFQIERTLLNFTQSARGFRDETTLSDPLGTVAYAAFDAYPRLNGVFNHLTNFQSRLIANNSEVSEIEHYATGWSDIASSTVGSICGVAIYPPNGTPTSLTDFFAFKVLNGQKGTNKWALYSEQSDVHSLIGGNLVFKGTSFTTTVSKIQPTANNTIQIPNASGTLALSNLQKEVTAATYTILNTDNNHTIFFNNATGVTVTVNNDLSDNFCCDFYNNGAGSITFVAGTATLNTPDGTTLAQDKVAALVKVLNNNDYKLKGELV